MDDIWIISCFNHTAFDANPIWKSPIENKNNSEKKQLDDKHLIRVKKKQLGTHH